MFALAHIPRSTRVLAETSLLQINRAHTTAPDILHAFHRAPPDRQTSYLQLTSYAGPKFRRAAAHEMQRSWPSLPAAHRRVLEIWAANTLGDVFLLGSRFNHSCAPNVNFAWNTKLQKQTSHAVRDIAAGEELTVMYNNGINRMRAQRQGELEERGFVCACAACGTSRLDFRVKDDMRNALFQHDQVLGMALRRRDWEQARKSAQALAGIQFREGFWVRELSRS